MPIGNQPLRELKTVRTWIDHGRLLIANTPITGGAMTNLVPMQASPDAAADLACEFLNTERNRVLASRLDEDGLLTTHRATTASDGPPWSAQPADLGLLSRLPADTLVACVRSCRGVTVDLPSAWARMRHVLTALHGNVNVTFDGDGLHVRVDSTASRTAGPIATLPATLDMPHAILLTGDVALVVRQGLPLPIVTLRAAMSPESARDVLAALARALALPAPASAKDHVKGFWSIVPIDAACIDGTLVITTAAAGAEAELRPAQGFATLPDVAASLAEIPADAYAALIARPLCWRLLAQLAALANDEKDPVSSDALSHLSGELSAAWGSTHEVMYARSQGPTRTTTSHGPVFGLLGMIVDIGDGELPLVSIAN